ncbi:LacI family DNA-binding transcriptional regulator [Paracoccus seriniphilus]|uniref:Transcriptional regulator, LacI family n=1 Tax=Paracoccus seriniphilus TaxID=184748 RepID=A0A239PYZ4_9RHOB|nr:LacI family DNA-binding transcriptional regulator [Paracoccus seriniphilus]WCR16010.1 LacI family DNA-binding transcriptional regulator [Paracoccus seriniphilus]SNT75465.1 transcriptional regulator, LacI family [Paracoccus seriniphilus]
MVITLKEVAERAGVSRSAVSRTFTKGASVSAKTRRKVEKAAQELGYSPNVLARSLNTGRTSLIGLVSNNFHNPIFLEIFDQFTRGLQERDLRPLLVNLSDETDPEKSVRMLRQYSVDGVIVASSTLPSDFALAFRDAGVAVVHAFGKYTSSPKVHIVGIDNVECGRMALRTLAQRGYSKVGFIGGPASATSTQDRMAGFLDEASRNAQLTVAHRFAENYSFDAGRLAMQQQLQDGLAEAYFCADDVLSIGALSALRDHGLTPGRDVGIIGLNDMEMAGWAGIDLTTIHQPIKQIVSSSIELMAAMLSEPDRYPEARLFPCRVIERGTLRPVN